MLVDALFYLLTLPFRDSPVKGIGVILLPPYAIYYWVTRKGPNEEAGAPGVGLICTILLVGLAYLFYEEAPLIGKGAKQVEGSVEKGAQKVARMFEKGEKAIGIGPSSKGPAEGGQGR